MELCISVRNLVEFVLRNGDIDARFSDVGNLTEGSAIHRILQQETDTYEAEYHLSWSTEIEGFTLLIDGRTDGFAADKDCVKIMEYKSTSLAKEDIREGSYPVYWAQALCYAAMACKSMCFCRAEVTLLYVHKRDKSRTAYTRQITAKELDVFLDDLLQRYIPWLRLKIGGRKKLKATAAGIKFPFPSFRVGQREMAAAVYRGIRDGETLWCQAPTGLGKTLSVLFPAVKAMGEELTEKIFYLTAKTTAATAACQALEQLREHGLRIRSMHLTAKEKLCPLEERICTPEHCPFAKGHYNRVNDAMYSLLSGTDSISASEVSAISSAYMVCPYELQLDVSMFCDCIICDYNYLFDPVVALYRYFGTGGGAYTFLVDEAHNLVQRSREMFTKTLCNQDFLALKKLLKGEKKIVQAVEAINQAFLVMKRAQGDKRIRSETEHDEDFLDTVLKFCEVARHWMANYTGHSAYSSVLDLFLKAREFAVVDSLYGKGHVTLTEVKGSRVNRTIQCLDPSFTLETVWKKGRASVLFSATLEPLPYYRDVLGGGRSGKVFRFSSPFNPNRLGLAVFAGVSTLYKDRENTIQTVADAIHGLISAQKGNYIVYFPSFAYLNLVHAEFSLRYPNVRTICQKQRISDKERADFLTAFCTGSTENELVGFCVLGGVFAEGVDLPGSSLIGCAVVGVGLPQVNELQELLRDYYQTKNNAGFDYAYRFPGINKVLQAVGRVIRTETDVGTALLIDYRFAHSGYSELFPPHWSGRGFLMHVEDIEPFFRSFWLQIKGAP